MKKLLSFALVCVMMIDLVPQAFAAKQELVVSVSSDIESKEWFQEGMRRFSEKHPKVEIILEPHEGISARPKLVSQIYTGNAPDVLYANLYWVKDFAKNGWITPVNDYFDEETINDFYADFRNYATVDGKLYGFFNATDIATIVYRKSLLEAAGIEIPAEDECWTWEQFVEAGKKLTQDTDNDGKIDVWGIGVSASNEGTTTYTNFPMYFMAGGTLVDERQCSSTMICSIPTRPLRPKAMPTLIPKWYQHLMPVSMLCFLMPAGLSIHWHLSSPRMYTPCFIPSLKRAMLLRVCAAAGCTLSWLKKMKPSNWRRISSEK